MLLIFFFVSRVLNVLIVHYLCFQIANNLPATSCKHRSLQLIADAAKTHNTFTEDVVFDVFEKICNTTDDL